jgi:hypothetical protein
MAKLGGKPILFLAATEMHDDFDVIYKTFKQWEISF